MGCPESVVRTIAGLQWVNRINFDVKKRVFSLECESPVLEEVVSMIVAEVGRNEGRPFEMKYFQNIK